MCQFRSLGTQSCLVAFSSTITETDSSRRKSQAYLGQRYRPAAGPQPVGVMAPITSVVFLTALTSQDMFLAGAFLLLSATFLLLGNLLADILLAWLDPRIRYE